MVVNKINSEVSKDEMPNEDLINFRKNEDVAQIVESIFSSMESAQGIKVKSVVLEDFTNVYENRKKDGKLFHSVDIEDSRYRNLKITLELTDYNSGEVEDHVIELLYPELVNDQYFVINGNRYTPIFQIVDAEFYRAGAGTIVFKNMFMPLRLNGGRKDMLKDIDGNLKKDLKGRVFFLQILKQSNITPLQFMFAKMGFLGTLEFLGVKGKLGVIEAKEEKKFDKLYFKLNKHMNLEVDKEWLLEDVRFRNSLVLTIQRTFKGVKSNITKVNEDDFWRRELGSRFTKNAAINAQLEKSDSILTSYSRILDKFTKATARLDDKHLESVDTVVRYMMWEFESICRLDRFDIGNKRIRITEHLLYRLLERISKSTYRAVNTPGKDMTIRKLKSFFSSYKDEFTLVKMIQSNSLMRFSNAVNSIELFSTILKSSKSGPQSAVNPSSPSVTTKSIHPSYLGIFDLVSTSSNEPGMSNTIIPTAEIYDPKGGGAAFFTEKPAIPDFSRVKSHEDDDDLEDDDEDFEEIYLDSDNITGYVDMNEFIDEEDDL